MVQLLFLTGRLKTAIITWDTCVLSHSDESNSFGPMDCGLPGSSVHGILQARILEGVAISFSRGSSQPRDQIHIPYIYLHWQAGSLPPAPPGNNWDTCRDTKQSDQKKYIKEYHYHIIFIKLHFPNKSNIGDVFKISSVFTHEEYLFYLTN